ncbi:MAG: flagellar type III secretion system pore protein FliP [Firmicutes bacterium]|nr:flagellar type III secretion system pore protein FliP [Bacillota bacterium]
MKLRLSAPFKKALLMLPLILLVAFIKTFAVEIFPFGNMAAGAEENAASIQIILLLTVLAIAPSILIMMTSFTRIIIVLSFIRNALGLNQMPPNQVLIGLSLFLSFFIMSPVITQINETAYRPYLQEEITQEQAFDNSIVPIKDFMLKQIYSKDLNMFLQLAKADVPEAYEEISMNIIIPAFITSELKKAFQMGFFIFIPFIVIDMIVASTLMSMGMMMLPPSMISLPFKVLLFVMINGWGLTIQTLVASFNG